MKILHLLASPTFSGPAETVMQLALAQRELGHEVSVAIDRKRQQVTSEELFAPRLAEFGLLSALPLELCVKSTPLSIVRDILCLRSWKGHVLHSHFSHDHLLAATARARETAVVRSIHAPRSIRRFAPRAQAYTVPFPALIDRLKPVPIEVLPPILDETFRRPDDRSVLREKLQIDGEPLIGMVSTFQKSRRHDVGLQAFTQVLRQHPLARLVLVGDGPEEHAIRALARLLAIDRHISFVGYQSSSRFVEVLQSLDQVWILGLGNDFSGRAAAQARACGVQVVAVREGGLQHFADVVIDANPDSVCMAARSIEVKSVPIESRRSIAERMLNLYAAALDFV